jgi:hypothetical protein
VQKENKMEEENKRKGNKTKETKVRYKKSEERK